FKGIEEKLRELKKLSGKFLAYSGKRISEIVESGKNSSKIKNELLKILLSEEISEIKKFFSIKDLSSDDVIILEASCGGSIGITDDVFLEKVRNKSARIDFDNTLFDKYWLVVHDDINEMKSFHD